jgi:vacuolar-type H+-ATPase subunit H
VAARVASIIAAAEDVAAAVVRDAEDASAVRLAEAEREAARVVEEARRSAAAEVHEQVGQARELARTVVERATELLRRLEDADEVRRTVEGLMGELDRAAGELSGLAASRPEGAGAPQRRHATESRLEPLEEARLMALQMAMAGRTRAEVEADLRSGLRLEDPAAVLDDVFGRGAPGSQRIPWSGLAQ